VVTLQRSVRDVHSSPRRLAGLAALPGEGAGRVKEGFCTELSSLNISKQLMVRGKWAFFSVVLFVRSPGAYVAES